ncbi:hypothetical protein BH20VER2_BH20VER2_07690 [soil metagenome]
MLPTLGGLREDEPDHYATLGLDRSCTRDDVRKAYRLLAKRHHPDRNRNSADAEARTKELNAAYAVLSDPARRRSYDQELAEVSRANAPRRGAKIQHNITQEVRLRVEEYLRGTTIKVQVRDPGNPDGAESYQLHIPAGTAPGAKLRVPRAGAMAGGHVQLRLKVQPSARFKVRGWDLRYDLRIDTRLAASGGTERIERPSGGGPLRVQIPAGVKRGELIRITGEGLPHPRGGRGDLLVRITYWPEVRISRTR